ncbi:MAG: chromate transporter, partial [Stellaceae bacterium]
FLGVSMQAPAGGLLGGVIALIAIFLPGSLLIIGTLPFWSALRTNRAMQATLKGVNASVVGLLLAALYRPVFVSAVFGWRDLAFAFAALILLRVRVPPWAVVVLGGLVGEALALSA